MGQKENDPDTKRTTCSFFALRFTVSHTQTLLGASMSRRSLLTAVALIGTGVVMGVVLMTSFGSNAISELFALGTTDLGARQAPATSPAAVKALNDQFVAVADAVTKSVVSISVKTDKKKMRTPFGNDFFRFFGPDGNDLEEEPQDNNSDDYDGAGSGVMVTADGYIVTNNHVVENAIEGGIKVTTADQREFKAKLVGRDPLTDLAVLKIDGGTFQAAHFADRANIRVGEWVVAVGNPLGLKSTVTTGIISADGRAIGIVGSDRLRAQRNRFAVENFLQTDAAINPGNSGGGLFNLDGSLVGINTAIASTTGYNAGYGFAIPIDMVKSVALDLIEDGKIQRGYIGIEITSIDETSAKAAGLNNVSGVYVNKVVKGGAAEAAGLEVGDVILDVDGQPVKTSNELQNQIVLRRAGDRVKLKVWRDKKEITKTVTLKSMDDGESDVASLEGRAGGVTDSSKEEPVSFKGLGFTAGPIPSDIKKDFSSKAGVFVSKVDMRGRAARRGLRPNTLILKADGKDVTSAQQLENILKSKRAGDGIMFVIVDKEGTRQAITLEVPEA